MLKKNETKNITCIPIDEEEAINKYLFQTFSKKNQFHEMRIRGIRIRNRFF